MHIRLRYAISRAITKTSIEVYSKTTWVLHILHDTSRGAQHGNYDPKVFAWYNLVVRDLIVICSVLESITYD